MEWLIALFTIPECTLLEDGILTDDTFLSTFWESFNEVDTLFSKILELFEEVFIIVFNLSFILFIFVFFLRFSDY